MGRGFSSKVQRKRGRSSSTSHSQPSQLSLQGLGDQEEGSPSSSTFSLKLIKYGKIFSSQEDRASFKFCSTSHVSSVMLDEDEIKERSREGLSREKRFKKRGFNNLSLFKYPTQVPVLLRGFGVKKKKKLVLHF